jgi:hypothetical protein
MGHDDESRASAANVDDAVLEAVAKAGHAGVPTKALGQLTGYPQAAAGQASWRLVREGRIGRRGDLLIPVEEGPGMESQVRPRRAPIHEELRAAEWKAVREKDPKAGPGGFRVENSIVQRRALRNDAVAPPRLTITFSDDLDADAEETARKIAEEIREIQEGQHVPAKSNGRDALRDKKLRDHAASHGTGVSSWELWRRAHPEETPYRTRQSFHMAAKRALRGKRSRAREWWEFSGRPEIKETAPGEYEF